MARTIKARVTEAFKDNSHEDVTKYLEWLRATMEAMSQNIRRTIVLILVLMGAFELVNGSPNTVIAIGSFKLSGGSIILIFIPAIVSFLIYQAIVDTFQLGVMTDVFKHAFSIWSPEAEHNNIDQWVLPPQALYWKIVGNNEYRPNRAWWRTIQVNMEIMIGIIVIFAVGVFVIQAYVVLHSAVAHYHELWLVSLCASALCSVGILFQFAGIVLTK